MGPVGLGAPQPRALWRRGCGNSWSLSRGRTDVRAAGRFGFFVPGRRDPPPPNPFPEAQLVCSYALGGGLGKGIFVREG